VSRRGPEGYIVTVDKLPVLGDFGEAIMYREWSRATTAARAVGGQLQAILLADEPPADGPRRGRPKKVEAE
jgi:hypothetical protein